MPSATVSTRQGPLELEYETFGEGAPLLLIMGIGAQMLMWNEGLVAELVGRGFRVIRFDNRDVGLSGKVTGRAGDLRALMARRLAGLAVEAPYTLSEMAADCVGLLDHLGLARAHVLGMSMGGMIAQTMALEHPQRVATLTSVMSSTGARRDLLPKPQALAALLRRAPSNREEAIAGAVEFFRVCGGSTHAPDWDFVRDVAGRSYERAFHPAGFMRQFAAILASGSRRDALGSVRVPTTVIHGLEDPLILPHAGEATAACIRGARFVPVPGMGHDLPKSTWALLGDELERLRARAA